MYGGCNMKNVNVVSKLFSIRVKPFVFLLALLVLTLSACAGTYSEYTIKVVNNSTNRIIASIDFNFTSNSNSVDLSSDSTNGSISSSFSESVHRDTVILPGERETFEFYAHGDLSSMHVRGIGLDIRRSTSWSDKGSSLFTFTLHEDGKSATLR